MTKNLISRKFISLLLVIVMALGLLPIQAMAENGSLVGGNTGGLIPGVGQGEISGSAISTAGQFTRITLVKIGFKHDNPAIADRTKLLGNYQVLGSIDVSDVSRAGGLSGAVRQQDAAKVSAWYQSNALDYAKAAYSGGTGGGSIITSVTSYAREGARKTGSWSQFISYSDLLDLNASHPVTPGTNGVPAQWPIWGIDSASAQQNYLLGMMSTPDSSTGLSKNNGLLENILSLTSGNSVDSKEFASIDHDYTYRLLVEPGWVLNYKARNASTSTTYAMTLRDLAAFCMDENINGHKWGQITGSDMESADRVNAILYCRYRTCLELSHGLFLSGNEFVPYTWDSSTSAPTFPTPSKNDPVFVPLSANSTNAAQMQTGGTQHISNIAAGMFGTTSMYPGVGTTEYGSKYAGYGLGIISPYQLPGNVESSTSLTVKKEVSGEATDADKNTEFAFELETHDASNQKLQATVTSDNVTLTKKDNYTYAFKLKGGQSASINIKGMSDETVYYSVRELRNVTTSSNYNVKVTGSTGVAIDSVDPVAAANSNSSGVTITFNNVFHKGSNGPPAYRR